jgi:hypothetical protein
MASGLADLLGSTLNSAFSTGASEPRQIPVAMTPTNATAATSKP